MNKKIVIISTIILILDQITKAIIQINNVHLNLISDFLNFNYYENTGAAFIIM